MLSSGSASSYLLWEQTILFPRCRCLNTTALKPPSKLWHCMPVHGLCQNSSRYVRLCQGHCRQHSLITSWKIAVWAGWNHDHLIYWHVRECDTISLGNGCGFYSGRDVYRISDLSCKWSIQLWLQTVPLVCCCVIAVITKYTVMSQLNYDTHVTAVVVAC